MCTSPAGADACSCNAHGPSRTSASAAAHAVAGAQPSPGPSSHIPPLRARPGHDACCGGATNAYEEHALCTPAIVAASCSAVLPHAREAADDVGSDAAAAAAAASADSKQTAHGLQLSQNAQSGFGLLLAQAPAVEGEGAG